MEDHVMPGRYTYHREPKPKFPKDVKMWDVARLREWRNVGGDSCESPIHFGVVREGGSIEVESDIDWYVAMYPWMKSEDFESFRANVWKTDEFGKKLPLSKQSNVIERTTYTWKKIDGVRQPTSTRITSERGLNWKKAKMPGSFYLDLEDEPNRLVLAISEEQVIEGYSLYSASERSKELREREVKAAEQAAYKALRERWAARGNLYSCWSSDSMTGAANKLMSVELAEAAKHTTYPYTPLPGYETREKVYLWADKLGVDRDVIDQYCSEASGQFTQAYINSGNNGYDPN
jgi:hypothetical protein